MQNKKKIFFLVVNLFICILLISCNEMHMSKNIIKRKLLKATPISSLKSEVKKYIQNNNYRIIQDQEYYGYEDNIYPHKTIGDKFIRVELETYKGIFFETTVTAFWIFNSNNKLIDIIIWKTKDNSI